MALVLISHDLGVVADLCTRVCVMYAGRIVEQGPTDAIFTRPAHPYTRGLLDALPDMNGPRRRLAAIDGRRAGALGDAARLRLRAALRARRTGMRCGRARLPRGRHGPSGGLCAGACAGAGTGVTETPPLLTMAAVSKVYSSRRAWLGRALRVRAVDDVTLAVAPGRTLGIVGESGCGKSTTGRLALGIERPTSGNVMFEGAPLPAPRTDAWRRLRARMQLVYQDPLGALDRRLTLATQIVEPLVVHGIGDAAERHARLGALLRDVGLRPDHAARYPHELSGGQRQRAVLARALATDPALLVCDEPVSALDVSIQAQVVNMLIDLQAARGVAMIFISHDLKVVRQVSHEVAVMYLGGIVEQGDPDAIFAAPMHPYTQALVSAVAVPGVRRRERIVLSGDPPNPADRPRGCAFHPRCRFAAPLCRVEAPELRDMADGRRVACHLVDGTMVRMAA